MNNNIKNLYYISGETHSQCDSFLGRKLLLTSEDVSTINEFLSKFDQDLEEKTRAFGASLEKIDDDIHYVCMPSRSCIFYEGSGCVLREKKPVTCKIFPLHVNGVKTSDENDFTAIYLKEVSDGPFPDSVNVWDDRKKYFNSLEPVMKHKEKVLEKTTSLVNLKKEVKTSPIAYKSLLLALYNNILTWDKRKIVLEILNLMRVAAMISKSLESSGNDMIVDVENEIKFVEGHAKKQSRDIANMLSCGYLVKIFEHNSMVDERIDPGTMNSFLITQGVPSRAIDLIKFYATLFIHRDRPWFTYMDLRLDTYLFSTLFLDLLVKSVLWRNESLVSNLRSRFELFDKNIDLVMNVLLEDFFSLFPEGINKITSKSDITCTSLPSFDMDLIRLPTEILEKLLS